MQFHVRIKLGGTGQTDKTVMDAKSTSARKDREVYWMKTLGAVFCYGLNYKICDEVKTVESHVGTKFSVLPKKVFPEI